MPAVLTRLLARSCALLCLLGCRSSHESGAVGDVTLMSMGADPAAAAIAGNQTLRRAQTAIDEGHPWRATQLVAPVLQDAHQRTHAAVLVAARAAAGWEGWDTVETLLAREPWVDAEFEGEARELLARSAFGRDDDRAALARSTAAWRDAHSEPRRAVRALLLARALERNNLFDSAAATYVRAAATLRPVADWLYLRAAGNQVDASRRARSYKRVELAAARPRIAWTEAQARERFSDALGAASRYEALGATVPALRLRLSVAPDSDTRDQLKRELLAFVQSHGNTVDARHAVEVLDRAFTRMSPGDELIVGRGLWSVAPARAVTAFGRAQRAGGTPLTPSDRMAYADALARDGRSREALAQLQAVRGPLAGQAAYQRARVFLSAGNRPATEAALRSVVRGFPADTAAASAALLLLADLETDDGKDAEARALFQQLYTRYPTSPRAAAGRFHAAIIALAAGNAAAAGRELDSLAALSPGSDDALAAVYWSGRAWDAAGQRPVAVQRWRQVVARQPVSYYGFAAARRIGGRGRGRGTGWTPAAAEHAAPRIAAVDSAVARAALLEHLGMDVEARMEYEALETWAAAGSKSKGGVEKSLDRLAAAARALIDHGQTARGMRLAQRLVDAGQTDAGVYRMLFPLVHRDELVRDAAANALDPELVAGVVRQESNFTPTAVSVAGARGLMQLLPPVAESIARALHFPVWSPALLFDPDANLQLGSAHLASVLREYRSIPRALAAYNAGGSRVTRWTTKRGTSDPELFVERIPFAETRDYVRLVQRNADVYRVLYDLGVPRRGAAGARRPVTTPAPAGSPRPSSFSGAGRDGRRTPPGSRSP